MWTIENDHRYFIPDNIIISDKWAMFDLDETLITTRNGLDPSRLQNTLKSPDNWIFLGFSIHNILLEYQERKYTIIIITNQTNINNRQFDRINQVKDKLISYGVNPVILIGTKDKYKKPNNNLAIKLMNLWDIEKLNKKSFMVGDAAGNDAEYLPYRWGSDDKDFANNLGVKFKYPNDIFYSNYNYLLGINKSSDDDNIFEHDLNSKHFKKLNQNVIIMMGTIGSGKSTFASEFGELYSKYIVLESDKFSNLTVMFNKFKREHKDGNKYFVIDATNRNKEIRKKYIEYAHENNLSTIIVWSITSGMIWDKQRDKSRRMGYWRYIDEFVGPDEKPRENYVKLFKNF